MLPIESHSAVAIGIHLVHEGVSVLGETGCENYELKVLRHHLKEVIDARSLLDVDIANAPVDVHGDHVVGVFYLLKLAMNQSLVQV